ncbi:MAG TPA: response regulator transcription factor [Bacillota bacterium]|nr:response regulator transcription factor [Bacillota bacterium]
MGTIKVLIVDDQVMLRESLKFVIEKDQDIEVIGCAGDGNEALKLCDLYSPDLVLMDIVMPVCDGVEGTRLIKAKYPQMKVIILTTFDDDQNIAKAIQNGADGYILKDLEPVELITIIKNTVKGLRVIHENVFESMKKQFTSAANETVDDKLKFKLTEKEISVIKLVVKGKSNREIAATMNLSEGRVKNIITKILSKLELEDRTQLAVFAVRNKLI